MVGFVLVCFGFGWFKLTLRTCVSRLMRKSLQEATSFGTTCHCNMFAALGILLYTLTGQVQSRVDLKSKPANIPPCHFVASRNRFQRRGDLGRWDVAGSPWHVALLITILIKFFWFLLVRHLFLVAWHLLLLSTCY